MRQRMRHRASPKYVWPQVVRRTWEYCEENCYGNNVRGDKLAATEQQICSSVMLYSSPKYVEWDTFYVLSFSLSVINTFRYCLDAPTMLFVTILLRNFLFKQGVN